MKNTYKLITAIIMLLIFSGTYSISQNVSINEDGTEPDPSAILDIKASDKGVVFPRVILDNASDAAPVTSPTKGLIIYNDGGAEDEGYYYWSGSQWERFSKVDASGVISGSQIYGEMYEPNYSTFTTYSVLVADTYYGWTSGTAGNVTGPGYCTYSDNTTADRLTIGSDGVGVYKVNVNVYFEYSTNNAEVIFNVFKNGSEVNDLLTAVKTNASNDRRSGVVTGLIELTVGDYVDFRFKSDKSGNLKIFLVNFSIDRI